MSSNVMIDRNKFQKAVDGSKQELVSYVLNGRCVSFEDYRNKVGQLNGINIALDHFKDTIQAEGDDD